LTADTSLTLKYDCTVNIAFYIDSTDVGGRFSAQNWVVYLKVIDTSNKTATNSTVTKEIATVLSLGIPTSINYGTINLGASTTAANNQEMTLTQKGNDEADIMVSGTNMTCASIGVIPVSAQKWALTDVDFISASSTALSATPTRALVFVGYRDNDALDVTKILYWNIGIATSSLKGICQGTSTLSVIAH
ncbi:MAG: hypothetical protein NT091_04535, partial [Candidatus Falkowbacteria bacterium]|nr:hypothetical protein [Candidatus Falkowbacteria bacterium]